LRRFSAILTVSALMMVATAAQGAGGPQSYKDRFDSVSYSGSNGSIYWESGWKEVGESTGPFEGAVHVGIDPYCADYKCLHILGQGETYSLIGAMRHADLSEFDEAELSFDVRRLFDEELEDIADAKLLVQVSTDGSKWKIISTLGLMKTDSSPIHKTKGINKWISEGFAFRFVVTGTLGAEVFIDNVEIKGTVASEPTTTTTEATTTTTEATTTTTTGATTTTTTPTTTEATTTTTTRQTTITTEPTATTTTEIGVVAPTETPPSGSGIRETASGVQADYSSGLFGSMEMGQLEVLEMELSADYKMAVEVIESSWVWMVGLLVVIAGAIVTGIDRRKTLETPPEG
jgi:hypothetical protein